MPGEPNRDLPPAVVESYQTAFERVSVRAVAQRFWDRHLPESDRNKLGKDFRDALKKHGNAAAFLLALDANLVGEQAVIDVALAVGFLTRTDRDWLLREIIGDKQSKLYRERPEWNLARGELSFDGKVIRRIRTGVGRNITKILDAFEEEGWPERIDSPILKTNAGMVHRDAIRKLNCGLRAIRFRSDGTGDGICWEMLPPSTV